MSPSPLLELPLPGWNLADGVFFSPPTLIHYTRASDADRVGSFVVPLTPIAQESEWLDPVLTLVKKTSPDTDADRRAFLINSYNLWTMYWVVRERRYLMLRIPDASLRCTFKCIRWTKCNGSTQSAKSACVLTGA